MSSSRSISRPAVAIEIPPVPLTIEGYSVLHQMMRFRWPAWRSLRAGVKSEVIHEAGSVLAKMEQNANGQSAFYSLLGHKGDLMFVHFRQSFEELNQAELQLAQLRRCVRYNFYTNGPSWPGYSCKRALFSTCLLDELPREKPVALPGDSVPQSSLLSVKTGIVERARDIAT